MSRKPTSADTPLAKKLGLGGDIVITVRHEPPGFAGELGDIGETVWQRTLLAPLDIVITFHTHRVALDAELPKLAAALGPDGAIWVALPRGSAAIDSDLDDDVVRASLRTAGWTDDKSISIDGDWAGLRFIRRKDERHHRRRR